MRILISTIIIFLALCFNLRAENDTLLINLKSKQVEKIAITEIKVIRFENITSINEQAILPNGLTVNGNNPNPFTEQTLIEFEIASIGNVEIIIYDNSGNQIKNLTCNNCQIGKNSLNWNCLDNNYNRVQSGVYFYEVRFNSEIKSKKMLLIK